MKKKVFNSANMKHHADAKGIKSQNYTLNNYMQLDSCNLYSPKRGKIDPGYMGPFRVLKRFGDTVNLDLPKKVA
jgi:hypothetical protein